MPKAYAYIRWSTTIQEAGDSELRQISELKQFEQSTGIQIVKMYRDGGRSAFRGDNSKKGELRALLDSIKNGVIKSGDYLVVESIDRITRQRVIDGFQLIKDILTSGVLLYTTTDQKTYSLEDPSEDLKTLLMISVISQRANEESEIKSKRLLSSWAKRRSEAETGRIIIKKGNSIPYGLRVVDDQFVIIKEEQEEIQRLFELLLKYGLNTSIKMINKTSIRRWNSGTLNKLINSKTVIGSMTVNTVVYGKDGVSKKVRKGYIENYYPKLIEPTLFYGAINAMKARKIENYSGRRGEHDFNIYRNLIFCSECGGKLYYDHRGSRYKDKIYPSFKCDNRLIKEDSCKADNIRFEHVLGLTLSAFKNAEKVSKALSGLELAKKPAEIVGALYELGYSGQKNNEEILTKQAELTEVMLKHDEITRAIDESDFKISVVILKKLSDLEEKIEALQQYIHRLSIERDIEEIDIGSQQAIMEEFSTIEGRGKLNAYFKAHRLTFHVSFNKNERTGSLTIRQQQQDNFTSIAQATVKFPLKQILKSYNIPELQDMFNLTVRDH